MVKEEILMTENLTNKTELVGIKIPRAFVVKRE